jgi:prolyl-tRNA editing enzyme YbaK/EbsC (Cys-tRNA(Pro) deacylase)
MRELQPHDQPHNQPRLQTPADLQAYLTSHQIAAELIADLGETPTVPAAAAALGVDTEQIVKTLLFLIELPERQEGPQPVVVIGYGETRVDRKRLADHFGVGKKRIELAPAPVVAALLGYPAGGVPPFGHRTALPVLVDAGLLDVAARHQGEIFGGGGDDRTMMRLTVAELVRVTQPQLVRLTGGG